MRGLDGDDPFRACRLRAIRSRKSLPPGAIRRVVHRSRHSHMTDHMPSPTDAQADLIAYLDFHVEAGADAALDEHPHDRFNEADAPAPALRAPRRAGAPGRRTARRPGRQHARAAPRRRLRPPRRRAPSAAPPAPSPTRRQRRPRPGAAGQEPRRAGKDPGGVRRLPAALHRQEPRLRRRQSRGAGDVSRRGARAPTRTGSASRSWAARASSSTR